MKLRAAEQSLGTFVGRGHGAYIVLPFDGHVASKETKGQLTRIFQDRNATRFSCSRRARSVRRPDQSCCTFRRNGSTEPSTKARKIAKSAQRLRRTFREFQPKKSQQRMIAQELWGTKEGMEV